MSESNSNVIPAINAVDGFNPADFVRTTVGEEGENDLYLDVKYRLLWFRLHHPNGKIDPELIRVDEKNAIVCCRIYADKADPADQFIGKAYSQRFSTEDRFGDRFLEIAETVAKGRALADAGYGTQFCMNGEALASIIADTAYEELCKIFGPDGGEPVRKCKRKPRSIETVELPIASAEVRDNTYSNLLSLLTLCPTHQSALKERGLKSEEMELLCYRTTPTTRLKRIVTELLERGCILDGVPGFYCQKDSGQWVLDIRGSGIMLPDRNLLGQIEAIQVRLDKVYNQKFYNLTSVDQYYGTQSKCCPHYVGVHEGDEVVCLTEGVMKSDLAYSFAQGSPYECGFVGLTGIPSYSQYERALEELDSIGVKRINVMVDSDYQVKEEVRKARDRYIEMGAAAGFEMAPITWTQKQKGVDDLYKHLFRDK